MLEEELREAVLSLKREFEMQCDFLLLKTPFGEVVRAVNSIRYFEVKGHQVTAFFDDTEEHVSGTLNEYEERLKDFGFIRIHKSFLVNFRYIESVGKNCCDFDRRQCAGAKQKQSCRNQEKTAGFLRNIVTDFSERKVRQMNRS